MRSAVTFPCRAMGQAGQHFIGLVLAQAQASSELLGQLVRVPTRTMWAMWTQVAGVPGGSATAERAADTAARPDRPLTVGAEPTAEDATEPAIEPAASETLPEPSPTPEPVDADLATIDVIFRLPVEVNARSAQLCGEFNGWSTTAEPMNRLDDGGFELVRALPVGRRWRFRYLLDGNRWENDWAADGYPPNAFGDHDSVVDLRRPHASRMVSRNRPPENETA